jgi:Phage integrase family.
MIFRRLKPFYNWFEGEIGAVKRRVKPIPETLWYNDYLKLKEYLLSTGKGEDKALWGIMGLHINLGSREGYESINYELERLESKGIKVDKKLSEIDLDEDIVNTSLIGLKWSNITVKDNRITSIEIYESKTEKTWLCLGIWLDKDLEQYLLKVREYALKNNIKSVVKSILLYENVKSNGKWSVMSFESWYMRKVKKVIKDVLGIEMTPHRLRSAHVSILAEFGVPLELICENTGFGVGWEDLSTAIQFYLRFSRQKVEEYFRRIEQIVK